MVVAHRAAMNDDNATPDKPRRRTPQDILRSARAHPLVSALGVLLLAILVLVAIWDWNWLRGPVERIVQAQTGRSFDMGGDLDVDLGRVTRVRMDALRFGSANWSAPADMAVGERVEFAFELLPAIFRREFRIPDLPLARPRLTLEPGPDGTGNWVFDAPGLPLDDMDAHLFLDGGVPRLEPLDSGVAGGDIRSTIRMDASESPIRTRADIAMRGLNLGRRVPQAELAKDAVGRISGDVDLAGSGNSVAKMLGGSSGEVAVGMGREQISNLLMELAGLDIAEALKFLVTDDRKVPIHCAFGDFKVTDGRMETRALAFDTPDTIIVGEGEVDLRDETLDLTLRPRPKDRSLFAFRSHLLVGGTFKDPSFRPDLARVGLRGAIALAPGSITPPAALLATLELGPGDDSGCGGRYAK